MAPSDQPRDYQALLKERVACPSCGAAMSLRNLRYRHICRSGKTPAQIEKMRAKASDAAVAAHSRRMALKRGSG